MGHTAIFELIAAHAAIDAQNEFAGSPEGGSFGPLSLKPDAISTHAFIAAVRRHSPN